MSGLNRVILMGRLGKDPELKNINGLAICKMTLATSKEWKNESGEKQEKVEWHQVTCFKKTAEIASKYLTKGSQALIEGELSTSSYEKDGVKKYRTEIIANNILFVGSKPASSSEPAAPQSAQDEKIPF